MKTPPHIQAEAEARSMSEVIIIGDKDSNEVRQTAKKLVTIGHVGAMAVSIMDYHLMLSAQQTEVPILVSEPENVPSPEEQKEVMRRYTELRESLPTADPMVITNPHPRKIYSTPKPNTGFKLGSYRFKTGKK